MFRKHVAHFIMDINLFDPSQCPSMNMDHSMKMYFHFDVMNYVLFQFWHTNDWVTMTVTCLACFALALINQILFFIVRYRPLSDSKQSEYEELEGNVQVESLPKRFLKNPYLWYVVKPIVYLFQITLGYFMMLIVMSYNAGFFISIVVGSVVGWSIFSLRNNVEPEECCN
jgi:copper transporter 1